MESIVYNRPVPVTRRFIKPADCAFAFGIPTSKAGFERSVKDERSDYARQSRGGWPQYFRNLLGDVRRLELSLEKWQVRVVHDLSLSDFGTLCRGNFEVVVLFSHWKDESVEFADGLAPYQDVLDAVPPEFDRILDLCICHPKALVDALVAHRPNCVVRAERIESKPQYWAFFYELLFRRLAMSETTYLSALDEVIGAIRRFV